MTYAVPARTGPAQVPITPLTAIAPLICGDSNQSSSRSAMLIVISRVMSAVVRMSSPRWLHASLAASTQIGRTVRTERRRHPRQQRTHELGQPGEPGVPPGHASASFFDHRAISSYVRAGSSS